MSDCGALPYLSNGHLTLHQPGNTTYEAIAKVSCSVGYVASSSEIICMLDGTWVTTSCFIVGKGNYFNNYQFKFVRYKHVLNTSILSMQNLNNWLRLVLYKYIIRVCKRRDELYKYIRIHI